MQLRAVPTISFVFLTLLCSLIGVTPVQSQWQSTVLRLTGTASRGASAQLCYKSGTLWYGAFSLFRSEDEGTTMESVSSFTSPAAVHCIYFQDRDTGLVATNNGLFETCDHGATWSDILPGQAVWNCTYMGSAEEIIAVLVAGHVLVTHDGGTTWDTTLVKDDGLAVYAPSPGIVLLGMIESNNVGVVYRSTDYGTTWRPGFRGYQGDCFSMTGESCDPRYMYLINENCMLGKDNQCRIYVSSDAGATWGASFINPIGFISGSMTSPGSTQYVQTSDGIYRSTNHGTTWTRNGGPSNNFDSRTITSATENLVFSADMSGTIYRTYNSGADSVIPTSSILLSQTTLFTHDTLNSCNDIQAQRGLALEIAGCPPAYLVSTNLQGADARNYSVATNATGDSVTVTYLPLSEGPSQSLMTLRFSDGTYKSVQLQGYLTSTPGANTIASDSLRIMSDTLGEDVTVPILLQHHGALPSFALNIEWDSTMIVFEGATYPDGSEISLTREPSGATLHLDSVVTRNFLDSLFGLLHFRVLPVDKPCGEIHVSQLELESPSSCATIQSDEITYSLCGELVCETPILSHYLRYQTVPTLRAYPNPGSQYVSIESSRPLTGCNAILRNELGEQVACPIQPHTSTESLLDVRGVSAGRYFLSITFSNGLQRTIKLDVKR